MYPESCHTSNILFYWAIKFSILRFLDSKDVEEDYKSQNKMVGACVILNLRTQVSEGNGSHFVGNNLKLWKYGNGKSCLLSSGN